MGFAHHSNHSDLAEFKLGVKGQGVAMVVHTPLAVRIGRAFSLGNSAFL
jgi:hypothetical protein